MDPSYAEVHQAWVFHPALLLPSCVALGELLHLSEKKE